MSCRLSVGGQVVGGGGGGGAGGPLPSCYSELDLTPPLPTTISPTFVDIDPSLECSITLADDAHIWGELTWSCETITGGGNAVAAFLVEINSVSGQEIERFLSGATDLGAGASQYRTANPLPAGAYTIKARWRRVSGTRTIQLNFAQLFAVGLLSGSGGPAGTTPRGEPIAAQNITGADVALVDTLNFPPLADSVVLQLNGVVQSRGAGRDYTVAGQVITWLAGTGTAKDMVASDSLFAYYWS